MHYRDQKLTGRPSKETKQDSPVAQRKSTDQTAQENEKKAALGPNLATAAAPGNSHKELPVSSLTAVDGPDNIKTKLVPASTVCTV